MPRTGPEYALLRSVKAVTENMCEREVWRLDQAGWMVQARQADADEGSVQRGGEVVDTGAQ